MTIEDIEALEAERCRAMLEADTATLDRLLHRDLRWAHASGKIDTKADMLAQFGDGTMRVFTLDSSDTEARLFGECAVATGEVRMDAMNGGVRREVRSRYTGIWSAHEGTPRLVAWQSAKLG